MLLTQAGFYGTLAAVRSYGRAGIEVTVADVDPRAPAAWSRHVTHRERCPADWDVDAFLQWLGDHGRRRSGTVLVATSDETAWLFARHHDALQHAFRLYQPSHDAVFALLDKRQLATHARAVGLEVPATWFPRTADELARVAREATFPVLLKPTTQILSERHIKGERVLTPDALPAAWEGFSRHRYAPSLLEVHPDITRPMVQAYLPEAERGIESVSGFIDRSGARMVLRGSRKVLQRPRRIGVGVCFEAMPVDAAVAEGLRRLCRRVGYFGVFEAEFIRLDGEARLIDFNPRFFGQMALDVARGVDLPMLMYRAALGDDAGLDALLAVAERAGEGLDWKFANRLSVRGMLGVQRRLGAISSADAAYWRRWMADGRSHLVDPVLDPDDWRPAALDVASAFTRVVRHPRSWLRNVALNRR